MSRTLYLYKEAVFFTDSRSWSKLNPRLGMRTFLAHFSRTAVSRPIYRAEKAARTAAASEISGGYWHGSSEIAPSDSPTEDKRWTIWS